MSAPASHPTAAMACPLCASGTAGVLWEDARIRVIRVDDSPYPGYTRVIWRDHVAEMTDLAEPELAALMRVVYLIEGLQRHFLGPDKINLASLGNQVPHLHWHVIPRWRDDPCFPDSIWAAADPSRAAAWEARRAALAPRVADYQRALIARLSGPATAPLP